MRQLIESALIAFEPLDFDSAAEVVICDLVEMLEYVTDYASTEALVQRSETRLNDIGFVGDANRAQQVQVQLAPLVVLHRLFRIVDLIPANEDVSLSCVVDHIGRIGPVSPIVSVKQTDNEPLLDGFAKCLLVLDHNAPKRKTVGSQNRV